MKLTRYGSIDEIGTYGELDIGIVKYYTVEQPWRNNERFKSCVPSGAYSLLLHDSPKYGQTYALEGDTVSQFKSDKARYACLFHRGNWPEDVQGCIAIGDRLDFIHGRLGVTSSKSAMQLFLLYMGEYADREQLIIEWRHL